MNVSFAPAAQHDLLEIISYIASDNSTAAERVLDRILEIIQQLADRALSGPEVRLSDGRRVRAWSVPPYRIYNRRSSSRLVVVRVYHRARRPLEASD